VGYQISPLLWDKVRRGLSAGRVQTVALRLIVEREREINAFNPVENWTIDALLAPQQGLEFKARFTGIDGKRATVPNGLDKDGKPQVLPNALPDKASTDAVVAALEKARWSVRSVEKKERRQNPKAPFTTSKLQQEAAGRLGFNVRRTMGVAQRLYEGVDIKGETVGLITYMRTDSTRVSADAVSDARKYIAKLGQQYLPSKPNDYKGKSDAQDAHEAIRPTNVAFVPDEIRQYLSDEQFKLYRLIWQRFVASQMMPAVFDQTTVEIAAKSDRTYDFRVSGSVLKFDGFLKVYEAAPAADPGARSAEDDEEDGSDKRLPALAGGQALRAAAALQRSLAGEDAGREGNRPAFHLRVDY
jgi:DNA topoisomerase-1